MKIKTFSKELVENPRGNKMDTLEERLVGVQKSTIKKLIDGGYETLQSIISVDAEKLSEDTKITVGTCEKIIDRAKDAYILTASMSAQDLYLREKNEKRLSTGSKNLDRLMGGGLRSGVLTQFFGKNGSGKTQVCFSLCVTAQMAQEDGGLDGAVMYLDTEGSFRSARLTQIAEGQGYDEEQVNKIRENVHVYSVTSHEQQMDIIKRLDSLTKDKNIKLIIIDSVISLFRAEYIGREMLSERQQMLANHLGDLKTFARKNDIVVVVTNQAQDDPSGFAFGDSFKPTGGNIVNHTTNYSVMLKKGMGTKRIAKLIKSPDLETGETMFHILGKGVTDTEGE